MLRELEKINPESSPVPVNLPQIQPNGVELLTPITEGFLAKEDFTILYDITSEMLHVTNPFDPRDQNLALKYSIKDWVVRIQKLVGHYVVHLIDDRKWIIHIVATGPIEFYIAEPRPAGHRVK